MIDKIDSSHIFLDCSAKSIDEAFRFIAASASKLGISSGEDVVYEALSAREKLGSTALSDGFAIPHAMSEAIEKTSLLIVKFSSPFLWTAHDSSAVNYAFALLVSAQDGPALHLQILSQIARILTHESFRSELAGATTREEVAVAFNKRVNINTQL